MSAIPITIRGTLTTKAPKGGDPSESGQQQCLLVGLLHITGLTVGGGPIVPPDEIPPGEPVFPIWGPPGIDFPDLPAPFPDPPADGGVKPPPPDGGWGYHPDYGWGYFPGGGGKPQPVPPGKR